MASCSAAKISTRLLLLAAQVTMLVGTAAAGSGSSDGNGGGGCIRRVDEVSKYGSCQCYRKCSHPEQGRLTNAASQQCFVDCVLRQGCICPSDGDGDPPNVREEVDPPPATPPKVVVDPPPPKSKPPAAIKVVVDAGGGVHIRE